MYKISRNLVLPALAEMRSFRHLYVIYTLTTYTYVCDGHRFATLNKKNRPQIKIKIHE